jgi:hypothetical protein
MKTRYDIEVTAFERIQDIPGVWTRDKLLDLLRACGMEGLEASGDTELLDYTRMALQDRDTEEAVTLVLRQLFGDQFTDGKCQEIAADMQTARPWEEFPDLACQRGLFDAQVLLAKALPAVFAKPEIARVTLAVKPANEDSRAPLEAEAEVAFALRLLADGLPEEAILRRLFEDQLAKPPFPEAKDLLWGLKVTPPEDGLHVFRMELLCALVWAAGMEEAPPYVSQAFSDTRED